MRNKLLKEFIEQSLLELGVQPPPPPPGKLKAKRVVPPPAQQQRQPSGGKPFHNPAYDKHRDMFSNWQSLKQEPSSGEETAPESFPAGSGKEEKLNLNRLAQRFLSMHINDFDKTKRDKIWSNIVGMDVNQIYNLKRRLQSGHDPNNVAAVMSMVLPSGVHY